MKTRESRRNIKGGWGGGREPKLNEKVKRI